MRSKVKARFEPFSDLEIEEYLTDDIAGARAAEIEAAAASWPELAVYLEERRAERREFFSRHPSFQAEEKPARSFWWRWPALTFGLTSAAAALLFLTFPDSITLPEPYKGEISGTRSKGAPKVQLTVHRQDRTFVYKKDVLLLEGDLVRLTVESGAGGWLSVVGRDGRGQVEIYHDSLQIPGGTYTLPGSLKLDDYVGTEQWYVILTGTRKPAEQYVQLLKQGKALDVPTTAIRIVKEASP